MQYRWNRMYLLARSVVLTGGGTIFAAIALFSPGAVLGMTEAAGLMSQRLSDAKHAKSDFSLIASSASLLAADSLTPPTLAQVAQEPSPGRITPDIPSQEELPDPEIPQLPPIEDLLQTPDTLPDPDDPLLEGDQTVTVTQFDFEGNTVFTDEELAAVIPSDLIDRPVTVTDLFAARSAVTQLYLDAGYATSGAFIPPQRIADGVVVIQVIEGRLTDIQVRGNEDLNDGYIARRIRLGVDTPLNVNDLLEALRLLQLDPRIETLSAELAGGLNLGESILTVDVVEGDLEDVFITLDNERSPSVGSFRQQVELNVLNLTGSGETFDVSYARTSGSDAFDGSLGFFLNPRNGTIRLSGGLSSSQVIEEPFDELDLQSDAFFVELAYRQPIIRTLTEELALGVTASFQQTTSFFDLPESLGGRIPLTSFGADEDGEVRVSALRFIQEWNKRRSREVFAVRSQFSLGLDALNSTVNNDGRPDSRFFAWRGQSQWARLLAEDTLLIVQADLQFADDPLLSLEQFGLGGQRTVRGYRQDLLLTDNGVLASAEVQIPIARIRRVNGVLQVVPFFDVGKGWNIGPDDPDPSTIVGLGLGLQWQQERLTARFDWGIPLVSVDTRDENSLQEQGLYFSLVFNPF
ncbi:MAG: ShlB/FhaC/HecB family hemolysin secretion/activation protein [Synechococcales bacterium]|nr:ShlB/FhaC/HecB family hemolysin secretion/activation protein [Synechococcales bacterium]